MADDFEVLSTQNVVQLVGGSQVVDAQQVMIATKPSGIVFPLLFNVGEDVAAKVAGLAPFYAQQFETAMADPAVGAIVIAQDVNAANQLVDHTEITALSSSGRSSKLITYPGFDPDAGIIIGAAKAAQAELDAIEAL